MAGYRSTFIKVASNFSGVLPVKTLIRSSGHNLFLPVYHLVSDQPPVHISHLYRIKNEKEFIRDLDQLLKYFTPIAYPDLKERVDRGVSADQPAFLLTFDDGLAGFYDVIAPILIRKGIPAVNFLNSDFIGNKDLFFRYKASILIDRVKKDPGVAQDEAVNKWIETYGDAAKKDLCASLLNIRFDQKQALDELAIILEVDFKQYLRDQKPYMDEGQIRSLMRQGFHFGAHSCDHPEYRYLDVNEQLRQTRESVESVTRQFALDYAIFAFPFTDFGVSSDFFNQLNRPEKIVDMTFGSAGLKNDPVPFHFQRVPMEMGKLDAEQVIRGEYLYYHLKGLTGKNKLTRA
jgi:peptidoglycan/xylan/chitin deacetylase (PgdA/CDA1 family)